MNFQTPVPLPLSPLPLQSYTVRSAFLSSGCSVTEIRCHIIRAKMSKKEDGVTRITAKKKGRRRQPAEAKQQTE